MSRARKISTSADHCIVAKRAAIFGTGSLRKELLRVGSKAVELRTPDPLTILTELLYSNKGKDPTKAATISESVDGVCVMDVLSRRISTAQTVKTDGLPVFNVVEELGHKHTPEVVYPRVGKPN